MFVVEYQIVLIWLSLKTYCAVMSVVVETILLIFVSLHTSFCNLIVLYIVESIWLVYT